MKSTRFSTLGKRPIRRRGVPFYFGAALAVVGLSFGVLRADPAYKATAGKVEFTVGSNVPYLTVSGSSSALKGGGQASVAGDTATVRNLNFQIDPKTFTTGMKLRDQHLYEKVFTAADGSIPPLVLQSKEFTAHMNASGKWKGRLEAQLSMRGVTKPVTFFATLEKKGAGAVVSATGTVKTSLFGVTTISYAGATINDDVQVSVTNLSVQP